MNARPFRGDDTVSETRLSQRFAACAEQRRKLGISLEDAAKAIGIAPSTLNAYEQGYFTAMSTTDRYEAFIRRATPRGSSSA